MHIFVQPGVFNVSGVKLRVLLVCLSLETQDHLGTFAWPIRFQTETESEIDSVIEAVSFSL